MTPDSLHAFSLDIGDIFRFQTKSSAELGCRQPGEQRIEGFCRMGIFNHFSPQIKSATKIRTVNAFLSVPAKGFSPREVLRGTVSAMTIRTLRRSQTKFRSLDKSALQPDGVIHRTPTLAFLRASGQFLKEGVWGGVGGGGGVWGGPVGGSCLVLQKAEHSGKVRSTVAEYSFPSLHIRVVNDIANEMRRVRANWRTDQRYCVLSIPCHCPYIPGEFFTIRKSGHLAASHRFGLATKAIGARAALGHRNHAAIRADLPEVKFILIFCFFRRYPFQPSSCMRVRPTNYPFAGDQPAE